MIVNTSSCFSCVLKKGQIEKKQEAATSLIHAVQTDYQYNAMDYTVQA